MLKLGGKYAYVDVAVYGVFFWGQLIFNLQGNANECPQGTIYLKKVFMVKEKKTINILITFFISHKSGIKIFLKWIVNQYSKGTCQHNPYFYISLS